LIVNENNGSRRSIRCQRGLPHVSLNDQYKRKTAKKTGEVWMEIDRDRRKNFIYKAIYLSCIPGMMGVSAWLIIATGLPCIPGISWRKTCNREAGGQNYTYCLSNF
jgi:hypothetical protein